MTITQALRGEHGAINPLLDLIESEEASASLETLQAFTRMLTATLLTHAGIEDDVLRPSIIDYLPTPPGGPTALSDHERIARLVGRAKAASTASEAGDALRAAIAETRLHFKKEEAKIFPIAERQLSESTQRRLAEQWAQIRGVDLRETASLVERAS
ncbi:MAG: hemerythrin domain-containing protein [Bryobacterales bacterium]|nr:hemerythrin domain-containing protein [Acidobacteriota bacterium]MCB9385181.1 hemerythrin domain-containing protein [Bryobacterales bacterium]